MARRKKRRTTTRRAKPTLPGWVWMLFGLAVGLSVAAGIYVNDRRQLPSSAVTPRPPPEPADPAVREAEPGPASRFTFYEMLPKFEVVIPEEDLDARPDVAEQAVDSPGIYVIQAGSFSSYADADRMKARLALLGIVSRIQKVSIDDKSYHRVRIGPLESLAKLNTARQSLRRAQIEVMVIRVGD